MRARIAAALTAAAMAAGAGSASAADLEAYIGKYPFKDKVGGRTLYEIAELKRDFVLKFGQHRWARLLSYQTAAPLEAVADPALGRLIVAWQCKPHDCPNEAVVLIRPDGSALAACFATVLISVGVEWLGQGRQARIDANDCGADAAGRVAQYKLAMQPR
jgi:hypothetical protein